MLPTLTAEGVNHTKKAILISSAGSAETPR